MPKNRLPVSGLLSYADVMELLSCSRSTVRRLWKVHKAIPAPHDVPGLGPRWFEDEIYGYLYQLRAEKRAADQAQQPGATRPPRE